LNIILTASGALPSITNGAADVAQSETSSNKQNDCFVDFAAGLQSYAEWQLVEPFGTWAGSFSFHVYWTTTSSSTNSVVFGLAARAFSPGDSIDSAYGSAVEVTSANGGANVENVAGPAWPMSGTVAIAGWNPTAIDGYPSQRLKFRLYRLGSGSDNLAAIARVSAVRAVAFGTQY
jgi:hypothetical protein